MEPNNSKKIYLFSDSCISLTLKEIEQIKTDEAGLYSLTKMSIADDMCIRIANLPHLADLPYLPVITDGTAGIGGNVMAFAVSALFSTVNAVEIDTERVSMLTSNLDLLLCSQRPLCHTVIFHRSYLHCMHKFEQDVVFLDPPWGGPKYKYSTSIDLFLDEQCIADVIQNIFEKTSDKTRYVVLKVPFNFDIRKMNTKLSRRRMHSAFEVWRYDKIILLAISSPYSETYYGVQKGTT